MLKKIIAFSMLTQVSFAWEMPSPWEWTQSNWYHYVERIHTKFIKAEKSEMTRIDISHEEYDNDDNRRMQWAIERAKVIKEIENDWEDLVQEAAYFYGAVGGHSPTTKLTPWMIQDAGFSMYALGNIPPKLYEDYDSFTRVLKVIAQCCDNPSEAEPPERKRVFQQLSRFYQTIQLRPFPSQIEIAPQSPEEDPLDLR